jgi:5-methylcytosine-specific restriction protein A
MPLSPLKPCLYAGCSNLVRSGYCENHQKKTVKIDSKSSQEHIEAHQLLYDRKWRKKRAVWLAANPWCENCMDYGKYEPAEDVHHVIPHRGDVRIFNSGPFQSLCHYCHSRITRQEMENTTGNYYPLIFDRFPMPIYMVSGAPGSGKNTFIAQKAQPGDVIIDLDLIIVSMTGLPLYAPVSKGVVDRSFQKRNQWLLELQKDQGEVGAVWFINGGWRTSDRRIWCDILHPESVYVIMAKEEECIQRIQADTRRARVAEDQCEAVHRWFEFFRPRDGEIIIQSDLE